MTSAKPNLIIHIYVWFFVIFAYHFNSHDFLFLWFCFYKEFYSRSVSLIINVSRLLEKLEPTKITSPAHLWRIHQKDRDLRDFLQGQMLDSILLPSIFSLVRGYNELCRWQGNMTFHLSLCSARAAHPAGYVI